jgi:adenosylcobinamide-GDP ribazoletransferase
MTDVVPQEPSTPASAVAFLSGARAALAFLTRIPCGRQPVSKSALQWAPAWFPVVGYALGFLGCLVFIGLERTGPWVAAASAIAVLALVTGGFHEDGLADTADALGGAFEREKIFVILKDSRIGSFGATALILALLLRTAALAQLGPLAIGGFLLGQTLSRTTPVWLMAALPYVTPAESARSSDLTGTKLSQAILATLFFVLLASLLVVLRIVAPRQLMVSIPLAVAAAVVCGWRFHKRAGGITGDFLGATQQVTDVVILIGLTASM